MSTAIILANLESDERRALVRYRPKLKGAQAYVRPLSIEVKIFDWLHKPTSDRDTVNMKEGVLAHFRQFVLGEPIDDCDFMKRVEDRRVSNDRKFDHEVWSVRPRFSEPQHRFFGFFALPDWVVVLSKQTRKKLNDPAEWHRQIDKATRTWDAMLPGRLPHSGNDFSKYVTSNWEHCDERWYPI
jgi:hypothetical protein